MKKKNDNYTGCRIMIPFKIDVGLYLSYDDNSFELVNGEAACHPGNNKMIEEEAKLICEGKDIPDGFVESNCTSLFPFMLRLAGHSIDISTYILLLLIFKFNYRDITKHYLLLLLKWKML